MPDSFTIESERDVKIARYIKRVAVVELVIFCAFGVWVFLFEHVVAGVAMVGAAMMFAALLWLVGATVVRLAYMAGHLEGIKAQIIELGANTKDFDAIRTENAELRALLEQVANQRIETP